MSIEIKELNIKTEIRHEKNCNEESIHEIEKRLQKKIMQEIEIIKKKNVQPRYER
jgi:hypothetical protein